MIRCRTCGTLIGNGELHYRDRVIGTRTHLCCTAPELKSWTIQQWNGYVQAGLYRIGESLAKHAEFDRRYGA